MMKNFILQQQTIKYIKKKIIKIMKHSLIKKEKILQAHKMINIKKYNISKKNITENIINFNN